MRKHSNSSRFSVISEKYFEYGYTEERLYDIPNSSFSREKSDFSLNKKLLFNDIHQTDNFFGSIYMVIACFLFSILNLGGKLIFTYYPEIENITICLFRGYFTIGLGFLHVYNNNIPILEELKKNRKKTILLFLRNFIWAFCNYSMFEALKYMRISSAFTLYNISPIFSSILSVFILKSNFTKFDLFSLIVCFSSVCIITKPGFLNFIFNSNISGEDTYFGIFLVVFSAFLTSIGILISKIIAKDFHYIQSTIIYGFFFIFDSLFLSELKNLTEKNGFSIISNIKDFTFISFLITILIGLVNYYNINFYTKSLIIGDPVVVLPLTYLGIVLNLIYNYFIFSKGTDIFDIIGSFAIIAVNIKRIFDQKK